MKTNLNKLLITFTMMTFILTGCGGGGGSETNAAEVPGGSSLTPPSSDGASAGETPEVRDPSTPAAGAPVAGAAHITSLTVTNSLSHERRQDPVTSGVPLPEDLGVTDPAQLVLTREDGTRVPAQFRVLSRWGAVEDAARPIKWVLVDFQADVPAGGDAIYHLQQGSAEPVSTGLNIADEANALRVDTGALTFTVSKERFDLFSQDGSGQGGITLQRNGRLYSSALGRPDEVRVEEQGPMRAVILVRGKFYAEDGSLFIGGEARKEGEPLNKPLEYTVRLHAYAGKSFVKVDYTLENNGNGLHPYHKLNDAYVDSNYVQMGLPQGSYEVTAEGAREQVGPGDSLIVSQGYSLNDQGWEPNNFRYSVSRNGSEADSGSRAKGYVDLSGNEIAVAAGMRNFWQKYPKTLEVRDGQLQVGLLPAGGQSHYFSGGWHMTDEILFYFHQGDGNTAEVYENFNQPMFARSAPEWYADSQAWGLIAPSGFTTGDAETDTAINRYEQFQNMFVEPSASTEGVSIPDLWESRHLGVGHYGWQNYGDLAWKANGGTGPFSALHYDWPFSMWLQFIRSGDERFLDLGRIMTSHSADMDQIHADGQIGDGFWWWEDQADGSGNHKSYSTAGLIFSHTWNGGYSLGYLLTGDNRYREATERTARAARQYYEKAIAGEKIQQDQLRSQGWSILALVNQYRVTGEKALLENAMKIFENSVMYTEGLPTVPGSNSGGYISYNQNYNRAEYEGKVIVTFATYHLEPLSELHHLAEKEGLDTANLEGFLVRSLNWLKNFAYVGGDTNASGQYAYLTLSYATDPNNAANNSGGQMAHNIHVASAFGYGYLMMRDKDPSLAQGYLDFGKHLFRDLMYYRTASTENGRNSYHDPGKLSPIQWGWFPTATKELGYIARGGQFLLFSEYEKG